MALIARILGMSLVTGGIGAGMGLVVFGRYPDAGGIALLLGCVGAVVGAIAGAAREIAASRPANG